MICKMNCIECHSATREDVKNFVNDFAQKHAPEIKEAKKQALESLDMMKYKLEKQYNKINEHIRAKQMAKAKKMEDQSYDDKSYDFN